MKNKYVKVNDIMELINTSNRGTCDYFIVDQIEKLCKSEKVYDVDKVVEQLEAYSNADEAERLGTMPVVELVDTIKIVKGGGADAKTDS